MNETRKFKEGDRVKILTGGGEGVVHDYNAHGLVIVAAGDDSGILRAVVYEKDLKLIDEPKTYTEDQVSEAVNAAADLIIQEIECDQEWEDLLSLMVNATLSVLKSGMNATLEDVVSENYGEDLYDFKNVRGF
ncbi:hypothetical protein ACFWOT_09080 [Streptomyces sp. NPDC058440]|uniref:hypothetical protein n=1 Tax=Streptomyces sp. NPDC058440 TaxID=3346501 RepID=UPI00364C8E80